MTYLVHDERRGVTHYLAWFAGVGWRLACRPDGRSVCASCVTAAPVLPLCVACLTDDPIPAKPQEVAR